jgi:hypothetical protein
MAKILLIDDDDLRRFLQDAPEQRGHEVAFLERTEGGCCSWPLASSIWSSPMSICRAGPAANSSSPPSARSMEGLGLFRFTH